jgi:hypothetical protein
MGWLKTWELFKSTWMSIMIVKVQFVWQRTRFIILTPSTLMFGFILFEKLWMKGIFCYRRLVLQIIQLTKCVSRIKFQHCLDLVNISWCWAPLGCNAIWRIRGSIDWSRELNGKISPRWRFVANLCQYFSTTITYDRYTKVSPNIDYDS